MSSLFVRATSVDGDELPIPAGVDLVVSLFSAADPGGPVAAEILVNGPFSACADLFSWLGASVVIQTGAGTAVWWGKLVTVLLRFGGAEFGLTLDGMVNKVAVDYTTERIGGATVANTTTWVEDADSIARYGVFQHLERRSNISDERATYIRDRILERLSKPVKLPTRLSRGTHGGVIRCKGLYQDFDHVFYTQTRGLEVNETGQSRSIPLGLGFTSSKVGFDEVNDGLHTIEGQAIALPAGTRIRISGSTYNNGLRTIQYGTTIEAQGLTATTISFDAPDTVVDSADGLDFINANDMVQISGSTSGGNNRYTFVDSGTNDGDQFVIHDEDGGALTDRGAGDTIAITRANSVRLTESAYHELPATSVTVTADGMYIAQQFQTAAAGGWVVAKIALRCAREGTPNDNLRVELCADAGGGVPSTVLDFGEIVGSELPTQSAWVVFDLSGANITINPESTYWIKVSRTGSNDWQNYYSVDYSIELNYANGVMRTWDGVQYNIYDPDGDLFFRVIGAVETTTQISDVVIATSALTVDLATSSGIYTNQYRDGSDTAAGELDDLIASGTYLGKELQVLITSDRVLHVRDKPTLASADGADEWVYTEEGFLRLPSGGEIERGVLPVGRWLTLGADLGLQDVLATLSPFYCVSAEYDAQGDTLTVNPSEDSYFDIGGISQ